MVTSAFPEIPIVPDVFADADPQAESVQLQDARLPSRFEVAIFIENIVGRKQGFGLPEDDLALAEDGGGIGGAFATVRTCS